MTVEDWKTLPDLSTDWKPHAPYILPRLFEQKMGLNQRIRRKVLSLFDDDKSIKIPILPSIFNNKGNVLSFMVN